MALTDRKRQFCWEYVSNGYSQQKAYMTVFPDCAAGSSRNGSYRYMQDPEVKAFIAELIQGIYDQCNISAQTLALELKEVAFQRREDLGDSYNENTKLKAIEQLQKQLGLLNQKVEAKVEQQVLFVDDLSD